MLAVPDLEIEICQQDWANPFVRDYIEIYPEVTDTVSEFWQAGKWVNEVDIDDLSPMWAVDDAPHRHFYMKELAQLVNGAFVIPLRWITIKKQVYAEVYEATHYSGVLLSCFVVVNVGIPNLQNLRLDYLSSKTMM